MNQFNIPINSLNMRNKLLNYTKQFDTFFFYDSNVDVNEEKSMAYQSYDMLLALGINRELKFEAGKSFHQLEVFHKVNNTWLFGYLGYDLKNEIEDLTSSNEDFLALPNIQFIEPQIVIAIHNDVMNVTSTSLQIDAEKIANDIIACDDFVSETLPKSQIIENTSQAHYISAFKSLQEQIAYGNSYEINYCISYNVIINHQQWQTLYAELNNISKAPFSALVKINNTVIISASPERFIKKTADKLISQPIKGTRKRGNTPSEDQKQKEELFSDAKERSENVMITDLVRNDLSKHASRTSVEVEELFGIYSFKQVHQMISTVVANLNHQYNYIKAIKDAFPMGSMTGAPKIKAMQLIEKHEQMKRGLYSGALGYIDPNGDYDFNVLIRSLIIDANTGKAQFCVGSAITASANAEAEYHECLLKADALFKVLS